MSLAEVILGLVVVAILAGYLLVKHRQRNRKRAVLEDTTPWTGGAFDATQLQPRLQRLRNDYLAELPPSSHNIWYHRHLMACARQALQCLPYFHDRNAEHENRRPAA